MATRFFSFLFFVFSLAIHGQETINLVPNPSFEEFENGCPVDWHDLPLHWTGWRNSPNSFSTCPYPLNLLDSLGWVPWNGWGTRWPADGNSYCGISAGNPLNPNESTANFREYLGTELIEPLDVGTTYFVSFKVSTGITGNYYVVNHACSHLGILFTNQSYQWQDNPISIPNFAHVYTEEIISDTSTWVTISGSFIAEASYTHMAIGVFFEFPYLNVLQILPGSGLGVYYYIDDVCVSIYPDCEVITDVVEISDDVQLSLFPNPANQILNITSSQNLALINVYSVSGELMFSNRVNNSDVQIDVSELKSGIYFICAEFNVGKSIREKLVIVR